MRLTPITYSAAAILLGAGAALLPALPAISAQAAILGTLTCQGTESITFSPALTPTPKPTWIGTQTTFGPCLSTDTSIHGGLAYGQAASPSASCDTLFTEAPGQATFVWSNDRTSTLSYTRTTDDLNGEIVTTETGVIISGEFARKRVTEVIVLPDLALSSCDKAGLASASGIVTLEILPF
jgi:hypothetical protein